MNRSRFFGATALLGANLAVREPRPVLGARLPTQQNFLSSAPEAGGQRVFIGYPDECRDFTLFAGSLASLVTDGEWAANPWALYTDLAIVVDFVSKTRADAEASLRGGWYGASEMPMGSANTIQSRIETNAQNARYARHLTLIATGQTMRDFQRRARESLIDAQSLTDVFQLLAETSNAGTVHLFSSWRPNQGFFGEAGFGSKIEWRPLSAIPQRDLDANRWWSSWYGNENQSGDFLKRFWSPGWAIDSQSHG